MTRQPLGRRTPTDFEHVEKYPITALPVIPKRTPVAIGVNWYPAFDNPVKGSQSAYWVNEIPGHQAPRGGHCVCLLPQGWEDPVAWWIYYNQVNEGKCVGEGCSRMMSLLNRKRYDPTWLWNEAKKVDEWPDTNPGDDNGTSVRAACDVLRTKGHVPYRKGAYLSKPILSEGISANRWATKADQVLELLGIPTLDYVRFLNSWGTGYPHITRMPATTLQRLLDEDGEACIVTDR
jgi:hypothetical protein